MTRDMTCEMFEARLADWMEDALAPEERAAAEAHAASCATCGPLAADLRAIARDAASLPALEPSRDLWDGIAARIEPAVVPIAGGGASGRARFALPRWGLAAAAAAVAVLSAGGGYRVAMDRAERMYASRPAATAPAAVAAAPASVGDALPAAPADPAPAATRDATRDAAPVEARADVPAPEAASRLASAPSGAAAPVRAASVAAPAPSATVAYDREIARLRALVEQRRADLDSATVAVIERNLRVIDDAIAQSRAALARDPRSGFLTEQLTDALDRKVELLRTAALLPART